MGEPFEIDSDRVWEDQRTAYDDARERGPIARTGHAWIVLSHAQVVAAATDPVTFSSKVSSRRVVPNGLDGAEHAAYRSVIDRYLTPTRVAREEAQCRAHAAGIIAGLPRGETVRTIGSLGVPYAVRAQSTWLGWPADLEDDLVAWMRDNHVASRSGDRARMGEVAERFDDLIRGLLDARRGTAALDVTGELLHDTVDGRPLTDEEIVSILRNWTAGDLGSLATSVGVIVHYLATHPAVQEHVRDLVSRADRAGVEAAVEEILRIDDPFVSNRRVTTCAVHVAGTDLPAGTEVILNWTAANRDPSVFGDADRFDPERNAPANLVFGVGPHVCPGRDLTLMELCVLTEELMTATRWIEPAQDRPAVRETPPVGGWARVPVVLR